MSNKNKYLVCALTLCAIGAVSAGLIALTNEITKNREHFTENDAINLKKDYVETLWKRFTKTFNF